MPAPRTDKAVIAHRGASGYLPEHTLAAYAMAHAMGADYIEMDLVMTRDGELVALHDIHLDFTTDVKRRFPRRARRDGHWYAADFTLSELGTLNVIERTGIDGSRIYPGRFKADARGFAIPTLRAVIELVQSLNRETGRAAGIYPELKNAVFHRAEGLVLEPALLSVLAEYGYEGPDANVFVQCFDAGSLRHMRAAGSTLPQIQLIGGEADYDAMAGAAGLREVAAYARGIGPDKGRIAATGGELVRLAHANNLVVHPYTFRAEELPPGFDDLRDELWYYYYRYGVDGAFTDFPDIAVAVVRCA